VSTLLVLVLEPCIDSSGFSLSASLYWPPSFPQPAAQSRTRRNDADPSAEEVDVVLSILHRFEDRGQVPSHFAWRDTALLDLSDRRHRTAPDTPLEGLTSVFLGAAIRLEEVAVITAEERDIAHHLRHKGKPVFRPFEPSRFTKWDEATLSLHEVEADAEAQAQAQAHAVPTGSHEGQYQCVDTATGVDQVCCHL
jgi:hypothetical protein